MRVLILTATVLACAAAAPSGAFYVPHLVAPVAYSTVALPATIPTVSSGDILAATIDANVQLADQARALSDQARELAEQAVEKQDEGVMEANDLAKEKAEEAFWAAEEKKWQALNAQQIAEAQIDGSVASKSVAVAKAAAHESHVIPPAIVTTQIGDTKSILTPVVQSNSKSASDTKAAISESDKKTEEQKEKVEEAVAPTVKATEVESKEVKSTDILSDTVQVESAMADSSTAVKSTEPAKEEEKPAAVSLTETHTLPATFIASTFLSQPWLAPAVAPIEYVPGLKTYGTSNVHQIQGQLLTPVVYKAAW